MKIYNVIEQLEKDPSKVFTTTGINGNDVVIRCRDYFEQLNDVVTIEFTDLDGDVRETVLSLNDVTMSYDYKEVVEEYTFDEAYELCKSKGWSFKREYTHSPSDVMKLGNVGVIIVFGVLEPCTYLNIDRKWTRIKEDE